MEPLIKIPEKTIFVPLKFTHPKQYFLSDSQRKKHYRKVAKIKNSRAWFTEKPLIYSSFFMNRMITCFFFSFRAFSSFFLTSSNLSWRSTFSCSIISIEITEVSERCLFSRMKRFIYRNYEHTKGIKRRNFNANTSYRNICYFLHFSCLTGLQHLFLWLYAFQQLQLLQIP